MRKREKDILNLYRFINWILRLPDDIHEEIIRYKEVKKMPYITTAEEIGIEKGLKEGIKLALEIKFGGKGLMFYNRYIKDIDSIDKLEELKEKIKKAKKVEKLLQGPHGPQLSLRGARVPHLSLRGPKGAEAISGTQKPHGLFYVIARSPHFGRRGNLRYPKPVRTRTRVLKREIATPACAGSQ